MTAKRVLAVNTVHEIVRGPTRYTAIDKRPVTGSVVVGELGLARDKQCDTRFHGGPDRALYAYAGEDSAWWSSELGREITPGLFGENLTTQGLDITAALIGERWRIGSRTTGVVVEVRMPREPCSNLSARMGIRRFHQHFAQVGRPGAYLKVVTSGSIRTGDPVSIVDRPGHDVTIADAFRAEPEAMRRLLEAGTDLAEPLRKAAGRAVRRA
ncbi:MAG TPA: MOSC domain-containing protein [Kribbella sp.]